MADQDLVLLPSEFGGEVGTAVGGRVVLVRGARVQQKGKGKKGKKMANAEETDKYEVHLLGGQTMSEMLFVEAWGEAAARNLKNHAVKGGLLKIKGSKVVAQRPQYSTSRLSYFLRIVDGTTIEKIEPAGEPWLSVPQHHPFVDISDLKRVTDELQVCLLAVVAHQPGAIKRTTQYGDALVCNATLRLKDTTIRASLWRQSAVMLASHVAGSAVALYQVKVKKTSEGEWEVRGTESTCIEGCPPDLAETVLAETDLDQRRTEDLTPHVAVDYETTAATPSCVGTLMSLLVPMHKRELHGVHEVHSVSILGLNPVLQDDSFCMLWCPTCKTQAPCPNGCAGEAEKRWIAKVQFADASGCGDAMIYHEACVASKLLPETLDSLTPGQVVAASRRARNVPWSLRLIYKKNETKHQNYLEIKRMVPTLTQEGVTRTWALVAVPEVRLGQGCPFARCADVSFDEGLGATVVKGREVTAVRLWVRILPPSDDEETAVPDTAAGLRVKRRVHCAADANDQATYIITQAGLSSSVQWLMLAAPESTWLLLVSKRGALPVFVALGNLHVTGIALQTLTSYVLPTIEKKSGPVLVMSHKDTPLKRKSQIEAEMPQSSQEEHSFSERAHLPFAAA